MRAPLALAALVLLPACHLYFGGDDDCPDYGGVRGGAASADEAFDPGRNLRDPQSGTCQYFGGRGSGGTQLPCDSRCGPCADEPPPDGFEPSEDAAPLPTWGLCESACTGLGEDACLAAPGCRGIYSDVVCAGDTCVPVRFAECWATDQEQLPPATCGGLDADNCSRHDDCIAVHEPTCIGDAITCPLGGFDRCAAEPSGEPGECWGEVLCDGLPPECPADTTPGVAEGCWTGECISIEECEGLPPACDTLGNETACIGRSDCTPYYRGEDCTCAGNECSCTWVFDHCGA